MKDYIYIGIIAALFLVFFMLHIIQSSRISKLMKKYEAFMEGKDATNLADAIEENFQQMEKLESSYQDAEVKMDKALSGITSTFHKLGIVKYDAFKEMGGNLSFALCLLDDNNNGFILNTMHGRESSYTYIKEIENGTAYSTLGEEEKQAFLQKVTEEFAGIEKERDVSLTRIINGATSPTTIWFWTAANSVSTAAWKS